MSIKNFIKTSDSKGFTLIEILITMAISGIVITAMYTTFNTQQKTYLIQEEVTMIQQNLRTSLLILSNDIRMAGYDPDLTDAFDTINIVPRDINGTQANTVNDNSGLLISGDFNGNGTMDTNETVTYSVNANSELTRNFGAGRQLLAENVVAFGLAFAFDNDLDGNLDTYTATAANNTQCTIWAVDTGTDNFLDAHLDTNLDGLIGSNDGPGGGGRQFVTGQPLGYTVDPARIKAVRVWILIEAGRADNAYTGTDTWTVGRYIVTLNNDRRRKLLSTIIQCRNMGL